MISFSDARVRTKFNLFGTICIVLKNLKTRVLLLVKLQTLACNVMKSNIPSWVFFTFCELHKWDRIAHCITYGQYDPDADYLLLMSIYRRELITLFKNHVNVIKWHSKDKCGCFCYSAVPLNKPFFMLSEILTLFVMIFLF